MLSKESKEKLSVNFMYEPPPGTKREREKESGEPEFKFEWQRKFNAPRERYVMNREVRISYIFLCSLFFSIFLTGISVGTA
jgi:hypothetical protein